MLVKLLISQDRGLTLLVQLTIEVSILLIPYKPSAVNYHIFTLNNWLLHTDVEGSNSNFDNEVRFPCDTTSKLTHMAWHPTTNLIACAAANSIYMMGYT